jgi:prepilin-type N-terminal cleavage/methylation domain-containing protein/prepilin-type processing-associated H-X9-DG protein
MKRLASPRSHAAFSLIELMIVILIIALLAGIGFPAFSSTLKRAEWSKVQAQMKSIVTAFHTYASDHEGYLPPAYFPDGNPKGCWLDTTIFPYVYPESGYSKQDEDGSDISFDPVNGEHLRDTVFVVKASLDANPTDENFYNHSFLLNRSLVAEATAKDPEYALRKVNMYGDWSSIALLMEGSQGDHNSVSASDLSQIEEGLKRYDGKITHFAFLDGHVEQVKKKDVEDMERISKGSSVDSVVDSWHTAWFGFPPDRLPSATAAKPKY